MATSKGRGRSLSEPSLQVYCGNFVRDRARKSDLDYERGKDKLAHWLGAWGYEEVRIVQLECTILKALHIDLCCVAISHHTMSSTSNGILMDSMFIGGFRVVRKTPFPYPMHVFGSPEGIFNPMSLSHT